MSEIEGAGSANFFFELSEDELVRPSPQMTFFYASSWLCVYGPCVAVGAAGPSGWGGGGWQAASRRSPPRLTGSSCVRHVVRQRRHRPRLQTRQEGRVGGWEGWAMASPQSAGTKKYLKNLLTLHADSLPLTTYILLTVNTTSKVFWLPTFPRKKILPLIPKLPPQ